MEKENILKAALFAVFLFLHPMGLSSQGDDHDHDDTLPLCKTQIMIVNQACKRLHYNSNPNPNPGPTPPTPDGPNPTPPPPNGPDEGRRAGRHRRRRQRGDDNDAGDEGDDDDDDDDDDDEQECCHWLQEIDNDCVCEVLLALPAFLSKPDHEYTVTVDGRCRVTYRCRGIHDDFHN